MSDLDEVIHMNSQSDGTVVLRGNVIEGAAGIAPTTAAIDRF
jgi:hypothetical protein